jgi:hypothetical protein
MSSASWSSWSPSSERPRSCQAVIGRHDTQAQSGMSARTAGCPIPASQGVLVAGWRTVVRQPLRAACGHGGTLARTAPPAAPSLHVGHHRSGTASLHSSSKLWRTRAVELDQASNLRSARPTATPGRNIGRAPNLPPQDFLPDLLQTPHPSLPRNHTPPPMPPQTRQDRRGETAQHPRPDRRIGVQVSTTRAPEGTTWWFEQGDKVGGCADSNG